MTESHFWKTLRNIFSKQIGSNETSSSPTQMERAGQLVLQSASPAIFVSKLIFRDGTNLDLSKNSIVVITGPNNSGKSSVLRHIDRFLSASTEPHSAVVKHLELKTEGTVEGFKRQIEDHCLKGVPSDTVWANEYTLYRLSDIEEDISKGFRGSDISKIFYARLNATARLDAVEPVSRMDWTRKNPAEPLQWLDFEIDAESEISAIFRTTFGFYLVVNRMAGEKLMMHVTDAEFPEFDNFKDYRNWLSGLPRLDEQGDGMKSFAAALLGIKVHPKSLILLDEPEAFLHYPQARKLAEVIATQTPPNTQIWIATHSDEIVRGLLDIANDRIVVVRLDRDANAGSARVLRTEQIRALWADPLLRTSDILSSLFHEVAIICEGETDVRFFRALSDAVSADVRLPDFKMYHVGGKDKIESIASALRALNLPVCALCDLDIFADSRKFLSLYTALGGEPLDIAEDVKQISRHVAQQNTLITPQNAARRLRSVAEELESGPQGSNKISNAQRNEINSIVTEASAWRRIKVDGFRALESATIIQAFERVYKKCKEIGLLLNREGELEGLCRNAPRSPKPAWLADVLTRDLSEDPSFEDARKMLIELRSCMASVRRTTIDIH